MKKIVPSLYKIATKLENLNHFKYAALIDKLAEDVQLQQALDVFGFDSTDPFAEMQEMYTDWMQDWQQRRTAEQDPQKITKLEEDKTRVENAWQIIVSSGIGRDSEQPVQVQPELNELQQAYAVLGFSGKESLAQMQARYRQMLIELNVKQRLSELEGKKDNEKSNLNNIKNRITPEEYEKQFNEIMNRYGNEIDQLKETYQKYENAMSVILKHHSQSLEQKDMTEEEIEEAKKRLSDREELEEMKGNWKPDDDLKKKIEEMDAKLQLPEGVLFEGKLTIAQMSYISSKVDRMNKRIEKGEGGDKITMQYSLLSETNKEGAPLYYVKVMGDMRKINGWGFIAKIDHLGTTGGNIIKAIGDYKIPDDFWEKKPWCEHCNEPRSRKQTYIIQNVSGEDKQIGKKTIRDVHNGEMAQIASTCIKKYLDISPEVFARWSTWADVEGDMPKEGGMRIS